MRASSLALPANSIASEVRMPEFKHTEHLLSSTLVKQANIFCRVNLSDRIREAMEHAAFKPAQLARECGVSASAVTQWLNGDTASLTALSAQCISNATGYSVGWLTTGKGAKLVAPGDRRLQNMPIYGTVPLISWVRATTFDDATAPFPDGEPEDWIPSPRKVGPNGYALRVRGDSMFNPSGKSYPEGSIIIVDPDKRSPLSGALIIAMIDGSVEATFKRYRNEDGKPWLQPLNPAYPAIHDIFRVLGTVIGKWEDA